MSHKKIYLTIKKNLQIKKAKKRRQEKLKNASVLYMSQQFEALGKLNQQLIIGAN